MYAQLLVDAMSPTNFFLTNPTALKRAFDTGGLSMFRGARNMMDDVLHNKGMPRQIDDDAFTVGEDLAITPGKVVFRNDLMEILQYEPRTEAVREVPLLLSPPWINKYYIMDLSPGRSFAEWAIEHGQTVFAISYRNPGAEMRDTSLEDYLINGPRTAIDVITEITGAEKVNFAGVCLGGLMTAVLAAYLQEEGDDRIGSLTLMNTLLDYSEPGQLGAFTDEETVQRLEEKMAKRGYLEGSEMRGTFDILRANDLIFNYVVNNWLLGEDPPAFDILAWNSDSTRMPADMHSFYLRSFYMENLLVHGGLELGGQPIRLDSVKNDTFMVAAVNDHIVPWKGSYAGTQMLGGDVDFLLTSSGHIAGIVNPPSPKAHYFLADEYPEQPDDWAAGADRHEGSWWEPWAQWISSRSGASVPPPSMGSEKHPPLDDAPGRYVHE
jgi:polyhydroxyalkanoate synthase subunit PhaC